MLRRSESLTKGDPARMCQRKESKPNVCGSQSHPARHYPATRGNVKGGQWGRKQKEWATANTFIFPKHSFQDKKTIRIIEVECWTPKEPQTQFQRTVPLKVSENLPSLLGLVKYEQREMVRLSHGEKWSIGKTPTWAQAVKPQVVHQHVLSASCWAPAKLLPWLPLFWALASTCWTEITKLKRGTEPVKGKWARLIGSTPGRLVSRCFSTPMKSPQSDNYPDPSP